MLNDKKILITGGTGSLGKTLIKRICSEYSPKKLIIYSRDEYKQSLMQKEYNYECLRYFIGDVRDLSRLRMALKGVDYVIHAAALKQIPTIEYNPLEAVKTNIDGSSNVIEACVREKVYKAVLISTDKAVNPVNFYGATKLCAEKLFIAANAYARTEFSAVRYGNVLNSRGSVIEHFLNLKRLGKKEFPITHPDMTRFWITLDEAVDIIFKALEAPKGLIITRDMPSMTMYKIACAIEPEVRIKLIGVRPGEKIHETLASCEEDGEIKKYDIELKEESPLMGCSYTSYNNLYWMKPEELRRKIGL